MGGGDGVVVVVTATDVVGDEPDDVGTPVVDATGRVVVVAGITTPDGGSETCPTGAMTLGPTALLCGTKMMPKAPMTTRESETAHHLNSEGRFAVGDFTSPNLVLSSFKSP